MKLTCIALLLLVLIYQPTYAQESMANNNLETSYDRFENLTTYLASINFRGSSPSMQAILRCSGNTEDKGCSATTITFQFYYYPKFIMSGERAPFDYQNRTVIAIADGARIPLGQLQVSSEMTPLGSKNERIFYGLLNISSGTLRRLAAAANVQMRVGVAEATLSKEERIPLIKLYNLTVLSARLRLPIPQITQPAITTDTSKAIEPRCTLNLAQSVELRGFRLGMSLEQVQQRFPGATIGTQGNILSRLPPYTPQILLRASDSDNLLFRGRSTYTTSNQTTFDRTKFPEHEGVEFITLGFSDNRIFSIEIVYKNTGLWKDNNDFVAMVSGLLNLPNAWQSNYGEQTLTCEGWSLSASLPTLRLTDFTKRQTAEAEQEKKRREEEEQRRKIFRP